MIADKYAMKMLFLSLKCNIINISTYEVLCHYSPSNYDGQDLYICNRNYIQTYITEIISIKES